MADIAAAVGSQDWLSDIASTLETEDWLHEVASNFSAFHQMSDIASNLSTQRRMSDIASNIATEDWLHEVASNFSAFHLMRDIASSISAQGRMSEFASSIKNEGWLREVATNFSASHLLHDIASSLSTQDWMRDTMANLDAEAIETLEDLANSDWLIDTESVESVDGATAPDRQVVAVTAVLICVTLIYVLPALVFLVRIAVSDAAQTGALALDVFDDVTGDVPGLDGALKLLGIYAGFQLVARGVQRSLRAPRPPDRAGDNPDGET